MSNDDGFVVHLNTQWVKIFVQVKSTFKKCVIEWQELKKFWAMIIKHIFYPIWSKIYNVNFTQCYISPHGATLKVKEKSFVDLKSIFEKVFCLLGRMISSIIQLILCSIFSSLLEINALLVCLSCLLLPLLPPSSMTLLF